MSPGGCINLTNSKGQLLLDLSIQLTTSDTGTIYPHSIRCIHYSGKGTCLRSFASEILTYSYVGRDYSEGVNKHQCTSFIVQPSFNTAHANHQFVSYPFALRHSVQSISTLPRQNRFTIRRQAPVHYRILRLLAGTVMN